MRALSRWRTGLAAASVSFAVGAVRLVVTGSTGWLTAVWFVLAAVYAFAALIARRLTFPERARDWLGRRERKRPFATFCQRVRTPTAGPASHRHPTNSVEERVRYLQQSSVETITRTRFANALVTIAAIAGTVLVFVGARQPPVSDSHAPVAPLPTSQQGSAVPGPTGASPRDHSRPSSPDHAPTSAPASTR